MNWKLKMQKKPPGTINLDALTEQLIECIEEMLISLDVANYNVYHDRISFPCPIHEGDNDEGVCIFTSGNATVGNWKCWTRSCEEELVLDTKNDEKIERPRGKTLFGFIRGVLSTKYGRHVEYGEAIKWASDFVKFDNESTKVRDVALSQNTEIINRQRKTCATTIRREQVRSKLKIPSTYFMDRGFLTDTLEKYDVGLCTEQGKEMFHRVVCPFYDDDYKFMVGCIGRTIQPKCDKCEKYHYDNRPCPTNKIEKRWAQKWINNKGFSCENYLYNYWFSKQSILDTGLAILVEGQPDIWRLEEAGFSMGLGLSGAALTDNQKMILDESGVLNLIILTDNDEAGLTARNKILKKCERYYNCHFIDLPKKDIGDMAVEEVRNLLGPIVENLI